jgi:hypothetical protein
MAPNRGGSCSTAPIVMLGDGCEFRYDYASYAVASNFTEFDWDYQRCEAGAWVQFDSGADAFPCNGCVHETRNTWSDSCGNLAAFSQACP